jgi:hypothetical protein
MAERARSSIASIFIGPNGLRAGWRFRWRSFGKTRRERDGYRNDFFLGLVLCLSIRKTGTLWWAVGWHAGFDFGQLFLIGTRNGGQIPVGRLFNVTFPGPAWLNGGELGTEASIFMVPAAIATLIYVIWFLRGPSPDRQR